MSKNKKLNKKNYFGLSISQEAASKEKVFDDITAIMNEDFNVNESPHLAYFSKNDKDLETLIGLEVENSATNGNIQDIG